MNIIDSEIWMIIGFLLIFTELVLAPAFGLVFLGLSSLTIAIIANSEMIELGLFNQITLFLFLSSAWFLILYKPLKKYVYSSNENKDFQDIIGAQVTVTQEIKAGAIGTVKWSGTSMNAKFEENELSAEVGEVLFVKNINGNILIISHKA